MKFFFCILVVSCFYGAISEATSYSSKEECWKDCWNGFRGAGEVECANRCEEYPLAHVPNTRQECLTQCSDGNYTPLVTAYCFNNCDKLFKNRN